MSRYKKCTFQQTDEFLNFGDVRDYLGSRRLTRSGKQYVYIASHRKLSGQNNIIALSRRRLQELPKVRVILLHATELLKDF